MLAFVSFLQAIDLAFAKASQSNTMMLRRNRMVRQAASEACEALPFVIRTGIRCSIGNDGFARFVMRMRDVQLRQGAQSLASLDRSTMRKLYDEGPDIVRELIWPPSHAANPPSPAFHESPSDAENARTGAASGWHVLRGEERKGPFADDEFLELAQAGGLLSTDRVWRAGLESWVTLADLPTFVRAGPIGSVERDADRMPLNSLPSGVGTPGTALDGRSASPW